MLALAIGGCGGGAPSRAHSATTDGKQGPGVPAAAVIVIEGWSDALRAGQTKRAAAYWAHPSVMVNGTDTSGRLALTHIRNEQQALLADETLSCGATLTATTRSGPYVVADFTLGSRPGAGADSAGCGGPARVDFLIRDGHITRWLRAPTGSAPPPAVEPGGGHGAQSA